MSIDSISLAAQNAYNKIINQPITDVKEAVSFHNMVKVSHNRFANMSPDQILKYINDVKMSGSNLETNLASSGMAEVALNDFRKKLKTNEKTINDSLFGNASLLDVVSTTNDVKNTLQTMVVVRDKMLEAFEKIMAMQI